MLTSGRGRWAVSQKRIMIPRRVSETRQIEVYWSIPTYSAFNFPTDFGLTTCFQIAWSSLLDWLQYTWNLTYIIISDWQIVNSRLQHRRYARSAILLWRGGGEGSLHNINENLEEALVDYPKSWNCWFSMILLKPNISPSSNRNRCKRISSPWRIRQVLLRNSSSVLICEWHTGSGSSSRPVRRQSGWVSSWRSPQSMQWCVSKVRWRWET